MRRLLVQLKVQLHGDFYRSSSDTMSHDCVKWSYIFSPHEVTLSLISSYQSTFVGDKNINNKAVSAFCFWEDL